MSYAREKYHLRIIRPLSVQSQFCSKISRAEHTYIFGKHAVRELLVPTMHYKILKKKIFVEGISSSPSFGISMKLFPQIESFSR